MEKLKELLRVNKAQGDFGIEIECEGKKLFPIENDYWCSKADGSLRGAFPDSAIEWVFCKPLSLKESIAALNMLIREQKAAKAEPAFSFRTSTHVHINMQEATEDQLCAMIYTYCIVEELLINYCGASRKANRFCLSINDGEGVLDYFSHLFKTGVTGIRVNENEVRYAALNIASLFKFGSLEVRTMRGTLELDVLSNWLVSLYTLREFAMRMENPRNVHDYFAKVGPEEFVKDVFPETSDVLLYDRWQDDVNRNFSITLELAFAFISSEERKERKKKEAQEIVKMKIDRAVFNEAQDFDPGLIEAARRAPPARPQRMEELAARIRADLQFNRVIGQNQVEAAPRRPRDANGRFVPGLIYDHILQAWVPAAEQGE